MPHRRRTAADLVPWVALAALGLGGASAWGQSSEFKLDEGGNWVATETPKPGTEEGEVARARRLLAQNDPAGAKRVLDDWIEQHDRSGHPLLAEAIRLRGDARTATGDEYNALYDYERVIKEFGATEEYVVAIERELEIGSRYLAGLNRKLMGARVVPAEDVGEELLIRVQERLPGSRVAERAGIELADYYYRTRDLELAAEAYDLFMENYPQSSYYRKAMQRRVYSTIARFKGPRYDGAPLKDAEVLTRRFSSLYPAEAQAAGLDETLLTRLDESRAEQMLESARWYLKRDDPGSARYTMQRLVKAHPQTAAAQRAIEMMRERGWEIQTPRPAPGAAPAAEEGTDSPSASPRPAGDVSDDAAPSGSPPQTDEPADDGEARP